jgi:hypothetical protein
MIKTLNYIYDKSGKTEYVVIPMSLWKTIKKNISKIENKDELNNVQKDFNPEKYFGLLADLNLNIEQELKDIRQQWTRNI